MFKNHKIVYVVLMLCITLQRIGASCERVIPDKINGLSLSKEIDPMISSDGGSTLQLWKGTDKHTNYKVLNLVIYKSNQVSVKRFFVKEGKLRWVRTNTLFATYNYQKEELDFSNLQVGQSSYRLLPSQGRVGSETTCSMEEGVRKRTFKIMNKSVEESLKQEFRKYWSFFTK